MKKADLVKSDPDLELVLDRYAFGVNDHVMSAMRSTDARTDPVARQYIPLAEELSTHQGDSVDPIGDYAHAPVKGIVHRYPDRVLFKATSVCPVYCRYCFRKTMVGPEGHRISKADHAAALDYIRQSTGIHEVILTGGDPLMLSSQRLDDILTQIEAINHIDILRIHSRVLTADPARIDEAMLRALTRDKILYYVMHVNHVQELTPQVVDAIAAMRRVGVVMLSQSVLLRGVNDNAEALRDLFQALVRYGVKPYMLHHPDRSPGTGHFYVSIDRGQDIMRQLRGHISGLCMPDYVLDIPGGYGKIPLTPEYLEKDSALGYRVRDYRGNIHHYE